jgi:hypothetical protein
LTEYTENADKRRHKGDAAKRRNCKPDESQQAVSNINIQKVDYRCEDGGLDYPAYGEKQIPSHRQIYASRISQTPFVKPTTDYERDEKSAYPKRKRREIWGEAGPRIRDRIYVCRNAIDRV